MRIVTPSNEKEYIDRMIAIALEGKLCVYFADDSRDLARIRTKIENHLDEIKRRLPETELYWANDRYVVDNRGRKGYVLLAVDKQQVQAIEVTEAFANYAVEGDILNLLATRENRDVVGGTYEKGLRW